jgi:hypothetical protein
MARDSQLETGEVIIMPIPFPQPPQRSILDDESADAVPRNEATSEFRRDPGRENPRRTGKFQSRSVTPNRRKTNRRSGGASSGF